MVDECLFPRRPQYAHEVSQKKAKNPVITDDGA
jgi:hypothetical protein